MSFNPCYVGLWSVSLVALTVNLIFLGFNPCYVGLWSVRGLDNSKHPIYPRFQSLLCWIMVCKHPGRHLI